MVWGGSPDCDHTLEGTLNAREPQTAGGASPKSTLNHGADIRPGQKNALQAAWLDTPPGKVLTGGTGTASAKQVSNAGSQYGNAWAEEQSPRLGRHATAMAEGIEGKNGVGNHAIPSDRYVASATCTRCGAWRGELGSEPDPSLYVEHIVEVFRAVRRVLHDSGTIWVNMGDSYSGSGKGPTGHNGIGDQEQRQGFVGGRRATSQVWRGSPEGRDAQQRTPAIDGLGPKQLLMMPARVALALQADGWVLRQQIIWAKPNPMPESVTDRCTTAHEYLYLLAKKPTYYFDSDAIREPHQDAAVVNGRYTGGGVSAQGYEPHTQGFNGGGIVMRDREYNPAGRNRRSVWTISTESFPGAHFATFAKKLVEPCILAGTSARGQCPACGAPWRRDTEVDDPNGRLGTGYHDHADDMIRGQRGVFSAEGAPTRRTVGWSPTCPCDAGEPIPQTVLDPFLGSGTTAYVARHHGRRAIGVELNESYARLAADRLKQGTLGLELW